MSLVTGSLPDHRRECVHCTTKHSAPGCGAPPEWHKHTPFRVVPRECSKRGIMALLLAYNHHLSMSHKILITTLPSSSPREYAHAAKAWQKTWSAWWRTDVQKTSPAILILTVAVIFIYFTLNKSTTCSHVSMLSYSNLAKKSCTS